MTTRRQLFLEGNRICDADGNTVQELTPEQRQLVLRLARAHAFGKKHVAPEDDPFLGPVLAAAKRRLARVSPAGLEAARPGAEARMAEARRQAEALRPFIEAKYRRALAAMEEAIPDSASGRFPLSD